VAIKNQLLFFIGWSRGESETLSPHEILSRHRLIDEYLVPEWTLIDNTFNAVRRFQQLCLVNHVDIDKGMT
jgi:hypothetical protein